mmetsp:Transcript_37852/g.44138  ORF Transcript_37852/g.44138 Transcript_37852/m.44138 type:complete len:268 (-) Transcript_37852:146-949(-)
MTTLEKHNSTLFNLQKEEIDVLENIYLDEIEIVRSTAPLKVKVNCRPYLDHSLNSALEQYAVKIDVELPLNYPEEIPVLELDHRIDRLTKQEEERLLQTVRRHADNFKGQQMVFEIVEFIRTFIQDNMVDSKLRPKRIKRKNENEFEYLIEDDEELVVNLTKKETYTPVTKENFLIWKMKFDAEMKALKKDDGKAKEGKLTGRQLFEANKDLVNEGEIGGEDDADVDYGLAKVHQQEEEEEEKADDEGRHLFYYDEDLYEGDLPEDN